jgi:enediyne biosynthesis protein E3
MNCETEISSRIEKIKNIFQNAKELSATEKDLSILLKHLDHTEPEFISIAYEGASMGIALRDFEHSTTLNLWELFNHKATAHAAQTHAGFGWAIAQQNLSVLALTENLSPLLRFRVLDGYGYYDGIFRQRTSIKAQKLPEGLEGVFLQAYDQGIGRSIWYACKGDATKVKEIISGFAMERQSGLWIGIGVACSYVGGCDETLLKSLYTIAGNYQSKLSIGATLAARARVQANAITSDIELACRIWCNLSAQEALLLSVKAEPASHENTNASYAQWLLQIEKALPITHAINKI